MLENDRKPSLRFKGFNDAWEQRKLCDFVVYSTSNLSLKDIDENGLYDLYDANDKIGKTNIDPINTDYISIIKDGAGVGRIRILPKNSMFIGTMGALQSKNSELTFIYSLLTRFSLNKEFSGSTIPHIYFSDYGKKEYFIPKMKEQKVIGSFFQTLDNLITLHQRKYDKLVSVKKALLDKMFPETGNDVPKIRFKGFNDAWEQYKFNQIMDTVTDFVAAGSFADMAENVVYESLPDYAQLVRTTDLKSNFSNNNFVYVNKKAFDFLWRVHLDTESIIMPNIGNCGEIYYVNQEILPYKHNVLGPNAILVRSENQNNKFLSVSFLSDDFQRKLKLIVSPNGQTKFNKTELKTLDVIIPSVKEQIKVGTLFDCLNSLITLHQRKYEKLKNIKKSLLQKMFA